MSDLIYRHDAIKAIETSRFLVDAKEKVMLLPTAQPKTGKWTKISPALIYECSECGQHVLTADIDAYKFCHGCGARMKEGE